jgi:hypothetical protein
LPRSDDAGIMADREPNTTGQGEWG